VSFAMMFNKPSLDHIVFDDPAHSIGIGVSSVALKNDFDNPLIFGNYDKALTDDIQMFVGTYDKTEVKLKG